MDRLNKINELRHALDDLRDRNLSLKEKFNALDEFFEAEKFSPVGHLIAVRDSLIRLIAEETSYQDLYLELFDAQLPESFAEIENALDAEEQHIIEESIFGRAQKFMNLVAANVELQDALIKYQSDLQLLLDKKTFDDETKATVEPYAKFIEAMGEKISGKKVAAITELSKTFDNDFIGAGLIDKTLKLKSVPVVQIAVAAKKDIPVAEPVAEENLFVKILQANNLLFA